MQQNMLQSHPIKTHQNDICIFVALNVDARVPFDSFQPVFLFITNIIEFPVNLLLYRLLVSRKYGTDTSKWNEAARLYPKATFIHMISNFRKSIPFLPSKPLPHLDKTSGSICSCKLSVVSLFADSDLSNSANLSSLTTYLSRGSTRDCFPVSVEIKIMLAVRGL